MKALTIKNAGLVAVGLCLLCVSGAYGEVTVGDGKLGHMELSEGMWRLDFTVANGLDSGRTDRDSDHYLLTTIEYELRAHERLTLSFKGYPALVYDESDRNVIYGAGVGVGIRLYQHKDLSGFFGEWGVGLLGHTKKFENNSTNFNFLLETGVGYQFKEKPWHIGIRYQHLSNASLGDKNSGVNAIGISFGYRF